MIRILLGMTSLATWTASAVIPLPKSLESAEGSFEINGNTAIQMDPALVAEANMLATEFGVLLGNRPKTLLKGAGQPLSSQVEIDLDPSMDLAPGGYRMEVSPKGVKIVGKDAAGAWYGTRSLMQLLPPVGDQDWNDGNAEIGVVKIVDEPRFGWRGMHLDVGRHFFPVKNIKSFIDWLAFHKLNVFHWHLSEDQGWRVEIKKYPKLTEVGGFRKSTPPYGNRNSDDGKRYGGFYTQEEIKEIVAYAKERHITIVPEIDMPGHMAAAIAAYPEFGNTDIEGYAPEVKTRWGVHPYTLAPTEATFEFVDDVLTEICELFPSEYIHIGGDEAPKSQWNNSPQVKELMKKEGLKNTHDVQSYFIKRVEQMLTEKGRKLIGWDEIREGGLAPSATVMSWRGEKGGIASAKEGHDVVMAANSHLYFDHYQLPKAQELKKGVEFEAIGGFRPIASVYSYDPVPAALNEEQAKHVLGVQAQLWTEYMKTWDKVEYMAFPRIAALAEIAWTAVERKDYQDFRQRLDHVMKFYDAAGVNRAEPMGPAVLPKRKTKDGSTVSTSLGTYQDHWVELVYDDNPETFFWADRALKKDDHITIAFKQAMSGKVRVVTGGPSSENGDRLENGVLEVSMDGKNWSEIANFVDGAASAALPEGSKHLRIRVTKPQNNWLILSEVLFQ